MGRKTGTESALALLVAFIQRKVWSQADLARDLGLTASAVRKELVEMQAAGVPLEREEDRPHVFWSLPKNWLPEAIQLDSKEVGDLLRLLARLPNGAARNRIVSKVIQGRARLSERPSVVLAPLLAEREEESLALVEDAASRGEVLAFRYVSASRGQVESREASPHKVLVGPPARFMATCHKDGNLKWFRVDRISSARLEGTQGARKVDEARLDEALRASVNGFRDGEIASEARFFVRDPESRWVEGNLPAPLVAERVKGGIRVTGSTAAIVQVARFVVGLGGAARAESGELRAVVRDLAEGETGFRRVRGWRAEAGKGRRPSFRALAGVR